MARTAPRALLSLLVATLAVVGAPVGLPALAPAPAQAVAEVQDFTLVNLINTERARRGLPPVAVVDALRSGAALPWSRHLASIRRLEHNPDLRAAVARVSPNWTVFTENVAFGPSIDQIHGAFMGSAGHRANILDSRVTHVAVGSVFSGGSWYVTQDFFAGRDAVAVQTHDPVGHLDSVVGVEGGISVSGWALDPDTSSPVSVHLYADGRGLADLGAAAGGREDVARAFPTYGAGHGFTAVRGLGAGPHEVCAYAINVGAGTNSGLGCRTVTVPGSSPVGALDAVTGGYESVRVAGWALDRDTTAPIDVHVYANGRGLAAINPARTSRPDVGAAFPGFGSAHGYDSTLRLPEGRHRVCTYGINVGAGGNTGIACKDVVVDGPVAHSPYSALDSAVGTGGTGIRVAGWTIDPDTTGAIEVTVLVDGRAVRRLAADGDRPDVDRAFRMGARHGYDVTVPASRGSHTVCVVSHDTGLGEDVSVGCRTVTV